MALENPIKKKLAAGKPVLGVWSIMPSAAAAEALASGGLDFLILDMEHGAFAAESLEHCIRAVESAGASSLVRIPGLNLPAAQWALDCGAHGIVVPQVSGAKEAEEAVRLAKFPPAGKRGYNPFVRAGGYSGDRNDPKSRLNNDFTFASVIVETRQSVDELDKICALPGLDMIYVGVYDLSVALGYGGDTSHPALQEIVASSVRKIRAAGKAAGMMVRSEAEMAAATLIGANVLLYGVDAGLMRDAARRAAAMLQGQKK